MEIVVRKSDLLKELQLVQGIVERKNSIPILSNVLLEARDGRLLVSATDLDVSVRAGCPAQVIAPGALTLGAKKFYEIARSLPESDVHLSELPDAWASLECERVIMKMAGQSADEFPSLPTAGADGVGLALPADALRELIARTSFAITGEDARYYLSGALMVLSRDSLVMVTTDGHRLSYAQRPATLDVTEPQRVLIPRKVIHELQHLLEGEETAIFRQVDNHLVFAVGERVLASKAVEGQFPAYEKVVAVVGDKQVTLERERLQSAVRRVSLLSSERSRALKVSLEEGRLELQASSPELGEARESLAVDYVGGSVEIGFNAQYLADFLAAAGTSQVRLELRDHDSQGLLRPVGEGIADHRYVVMPMRL